MDLRQKTLKGFFWSGVAQAGKQGGQYFITILLASLLSPMDFGLLAMAMVFMNFANVFSDLGISAALIQKQDVEARHFSSAFWLNVGVGILLTLICMASAPLIAHFYRKPELAPIIIVVSANFFLASLCIVQQTVLTREMEFRKLAIKDLIGLFSSGALGVYLAYHGFGVWSLVYQLLSFSSLNIIVLWSLSSWRPRFHFSVTDFKDIFKFSANMTAFNIINYFARNTDQLVIGKALGPQLLGIYSLAYKVMLYPLQNISVVITKVLFPVFSKIQNEYERIKNAYVTMTRVISLITFPLMAGLFVLAPELVRYVLGPQWEPAIILIRIFCLTGAVQSITANVGNIIISQGRADLQLKLGVMGAVVVIIAIASGIWWGIVGIAVAYTVETVLFGMYLILVSNALIKLEPKRYFSSLYTSVLVAILMAGALAALKAIFPINNVLQLVYSCLVGLGIYFGILYFTGVISEFRQRLAE